MDKMEKLKFRSKSNEILLQMLVVAVIQIIFSKCDALKDLMDKRGAMVKALALKGEALYANRCDDATRQCDSCTQNSCTYDWPDFDCYWSRNQTDCPPVVNQTSCMFALKNESVVKVPASSDASDEDVKDTTCTYKPIDADFIQNAKTDDGVISQMIGSLNGVHRQYPGVDMCNDYDPTTETWYVSATTGPKNVILIIDHSGSMNTNNRIGMARDAARAVMDTLSETDFTNIILFNTAAVSFQDKIFPYAGSNVAATQAFIDTIAAGGGTNWDSGFIEAYRTLENTKNDGSLNKCQNVILFLTDGTGNTPQIFKTIKALDIGWDCTIFTYSIGDGVRAQDQGILRRIACEHKGVYTPIDKIANLAKIMSSYFAFISKGNRVEAVLWSPPFTDETGLGQVVMASYPVYDRETSPVKLVAVAAILQYYSDFAALGDPSTIQNAFHGPSAQCWSFQLTECQLEVIRGAQICKTCPDVNATIANMTPKVCPAIVNQSSVFCGPTGNITRSVQTMTNFTHCCDQQMCTKIPGPCSADNYYFSLLVSVFVVLFVLLLILIFCLIQHRLRRRREDNLLAYLNDDNNSQGVGGQSGTQLINTRTNVH